MSGKLKIGVFGGYRGMTMITVLMGHPDAELVAVCDKVQWILDNVKNEAEKHGQTVACYNNFEDFFKHDMDAVVLANYANEHAPYAIRLLRSGRHVLSEVLPCETMAQAVELIEAVEESGCVYAYAENYCYMAHTFEMWRRYRNGDIGEVMYAEGEYVHDCSSIWPGITYGERNHLRNRMHPAFYCTHSIGPMLTITGRRPVQVVGFETMPHPDMIALGGIGGMAGGCMIAVTLDNGAICKSIHGGLKREPGSINYEVYGMKGMMESDRFDGGRLNVYREGEKLCIGDWEKYETKPFIAPELLEKIGVYGHGGSDFYSTHFFLEKILGRPDGDTYSVDVYQAVDMGICGILAYRSILNGNAPVKVPNLRNKEERDAYRNDNACTNPEIAGDQLLPVSSYPDPHIPDEVYERVAELHRQGKNAE